MSSPVDLQPRATTTTVPYVGRFRLVGDLEVKEMMFLLFAFVSVAAASILTIVRLTEGSLIDPEIKFAILLLVNLVFILYYVIHGVFFERPFELLVSVIATTIVMLYCIVEYCVHGRHGIDDNNNKLKLGRLIAVCALGPVDIVLGCIIAFKFYTSRSLIFRTVGGNAVYQDMCQTMFMFTAFLKFDFQLVISLLVMILVGNTDGVTLGDKLVIGLGTPFSFCWVILGFIMIRYEIMKVSNLFWVLGLAEPAYVIYLFVRTGKEMGETKHENYMSSDDVLSEEMLRYCLIVAGIIALLIRGCVVVLSVLITRNFGKGLKEKVYCDESGDTRAITHGQQQTDYEST